MYVTPDTTIHILKNIPLNKSYENTVYYPDANAQRDAFMKYKKFTLTDYSYQRTQLGTLRVAIAYEKLYDCDYLMFQNTAFGNKWFYAFITGVSYISNEVAEIYYEIDVMQTWAYDYSFLPSFVERRHSDQDVLYENTQPEGLELGNVYNTVKRENYDFEVYYNLILSPNKLITSDYTGLTFLTGGRINGIYNGLLYVRTTNPNDPGSLSKYINDVISNGLENTVVAFYQSASGGGHEVKQISFTPDTPGYSFSPKNKKLYEFPFMKFTVTSNRGIAKDYKPERWAPDDNGNIRGEIHSVAFPEAESRFQPLNYNDGNTAIDNAVNYSNFPTCAFSGNSFAVWWAQNKNNYIASMNAIGTTYDTNVQIAQNTFQMAARSANASAAMGTNSANTSLANATMTNNTAMSNLERSTNTGIAEGAINTVGNIIGLNLGGAVSSATGIVNTMVNAQNQADSLNASLQASQNSVNTALVNTGIAQSAALKNASTAQASSQLSALTAKENATNQLVAKKRDIENLPPTAKGNATGDGLAFSSDPGFMIAQCTIKDEYAKIIDDYFTVYGYAQNSLYDSATLNNRINRPHFTYLKTVGCAIKGDLNSNDQIVIQSIYDNGIETWDKLENVGNYRINNQPS